MGLSSNVIIDILRFHKRPFIEYVIKFVNRQMYQCALCLKEVPAVLCEHVFVEQDDVTFESDEKWMHIPMDKYRRLCIPAWLKTKTVVFLSSSLVKLLDENFHLIHRKSCNEVGKAAMMKKLEDHDDQLILSVLRDWTSKLVPGIGSKYSLHLGKIDELWPRLLELIPSHMHRISIEVDDYWPVAFDKCMFDYESFKSAFQLAAEVVLNDVSLNMVGREQMIDAFFTPSLI